MVHIERWLCFPGGSSSSRQKLASRELKTGQLLKVLDWRTPTFSSAAMQTRFSNIFEATNILTCNTSGSQPIFNAQLSALSAVQRYDDRGALDADGRPRLGISTRLECERPASLLSHALHLYLGPGGQWEAERGAPFQRQRRQVRMVFIRINIITSIHKCK